MRHKPLPSAYALLVLPLLAGVLQCTRTAAIAASPPIWPSGTGDGPSAAAALAAAGSDRSGGTIAATCATWTSRGDRGLQTLLLAFWDQQRNSLNTHAPHGSDTAAYWVFAEAWEAVEDVAAALGGHRYQGLSRRANRKAAHPE